jgi:hypothetical protein
MKRLDAVEVIYQLRKFELRVRVYREYLGETTGIVIEEADVLKALEKCQAMQNARPTKYIKKTKVTIRRSREWFDMFLMAKRDVIGRRTVFY